MGFWDSSEPYRGNNFEFSCFSSLGTDDLVRLADVIRVFPKYTKAPRKIGKWYNRV